MIKILLTFMHEGDFKVVGGLYAEYHLEITCRGVKQITLQNTFYEWSIEHIRVGLLYYQDPGIFFWPTLSERVWEQGSEILDKYEKLIWASNRNNIFTKTRHKFNFINTEECFMILYWMRNMERF